jgi:hypothetical protein
MKCRSCGAEIIFLMTDKGKRIPVDADTVQPKDDYFDANRHKAHFATCPQSQKWRKKK